MKVGGTSTGPAHKEICLDRLRHERDPGTDGLLKIYKDKLSDLFGDRFLTQSRTLKNSRNSALYEFLFCVGNSRGIDPAKRIAEYLLKGM